MSGNEFETRKRLYVDAMGPEVRIGVLQHQETLRVGRIGRFQLRHPSGAVLGKLNPEDGLLVVRIGKSKPARMGTRLVLRKAYSSEEARKWMSDRGSKCKGLDLVTMEVGYEFDPFAEAVTGREWWVVSQAFGTEAEAHALAQKQPQSHLISLHSVRLSAPEGEVEVSIGGREAFVMPLYARLEPVDEGPHRIILHDVVVGVGFHWQHLEDQKLRGVFEGRIDNRGKLTAINELPVEEYLYSVNSSEMMAQCPMGLLEAQTIAARNTIFATMDKHHNADDFDICADDHCQCYRGSSRERETSRLAVLNTLGEVLVHDRRVCDCRYSKICGGVAEDSGSVWEGFDMPYMKPVWDGVSGGEESMYFMPANTEERAKRFIDSRPDVFCNTATPEDIPQYLRYSGRYFRWTVEFTREEFEASLNRFPQWNVGEFQDMQVLSRGASGRIEYIRVIGSDRTVEIGREYNVRLAFAPFFLYSSCFYPVIERGADGRVTRIRLVGGGWGHGAGLCQIGAAMMAERGFSSGAILSHYYKDTRIARLFGRGADLARILANERRAGDLRLGDRCFEYFNCYAAARCPVYQKAIGLRARAGAEGGAAVFRQDSSAGRPADLDELGITECEFLDFTGETAHPKEGVV